MKMQKMSEMTEIKSHASSHHQKDVDISLNEEDLNTVEANQLN